MENAQKFVDEILNSIKDTIFIFDVETGEPVIWNKAMREISGYSEDEISAKKMIAQLYSEDDQILLKNSINGIFETGESVCVVELITKDGRRIPTEYSTSIIKNPINGRDCILAVGRNIAKRRKSEAELIELKNMYSTLVESTNDMVFLIDAEGYVVFGNSYVKSHYEIPDTANIENFRLPLCFFWCGESINIVDSAIEKVKGGSDEETLEAMCFGRYYELKITPLINSDVLTGMMCFGVDITKRKIAEEALRESEEKYRILFENNRDAIMTLEPPTWKFTSCNSATVEMFRTRNANVFTSLGPWELSPETQPDGRASDEKARDMIEAAMREGSNFFEWTHKRFCGEEFPATVLLSRVEIGGRVFLHATVRDITEHKALESEQRASKEKYQGIFDESVATIYMFDDKKNFIDSNQAGLNLLGYTREELMSMSIPDVDADPVIVLPAHEQLLCGDRLVDYEHRLKRKNGEIITVLNNSRPITDKDGKVVGMLSTLIDITQRKKTQEEKLELERQLLQLQKMEAIGQLAGGIAHDFNSIIAIISGSASMIARTTPSDAPIINNLERIQKAARRAKDITMKLLTFARKEKLSIKVVCANEIVGDVIDMLKSTVSAKIDIATENDGGMKWIDVDSNQILQALLNISLNACDAMPDGGDLTVTVRRTAVDEATAAERGAQSGEFIVISIEDTGTGIDKDKADKIFDPFFTTKDRGKGSGLGLSVSHGIIKEHRGFIEVETEKGKGTTFSVFLPAADPAKTAPAKENGTGNVKTSQGNILVIDDDRDFAMMMKETLESEGFIAHAALSGKEAIDYYKDSGSDINVVLLDMLLPGMPGTEIYHELKKLNPDAKIVLCSGYSVEGDASALLKKGAKAFIQKPFEIDDVIDVISGLL